MELTEHTVDFVPILSILLHGMPIWAIIGFILHRWLKRSDEHLEAKETELREQFSKLHTKLDHLQEINELVNRRIDTVDVAISYLIKDSFSSSMIARGSGVWPRIFQREDSVK